MAAPLVSVVVPCLDEEEVLGQTHERLTSSLADLPGCEYEVIYVDDGSTDRTWDLLSRTARSDEHVRLVRFNRNFGHQAGLLAGLRQARGDAVVIIDADLQDPPELIVDMVEKWRAGWQVVTGRRLDRRGETRFKRWSAFLFYRLLRSVAEHPVAVDSGDFRLLDRAVVDTIAEMPENHLYLRGLISWAGFPECSVEYVRAPRAAGSGKYTLRKMLRLSGEGLVSSSSFPLRIPGLLGITSLSAFAVTRLLLGPRRTPRGLGTFGAQALLLGLFGEYFERIYRQVRGRPPYVVRELVDGSAVRPGIDQMRRVS